MLWQEFECQVGTVRSKTVFFFIKYLGKYLGITVVFSGFLFKGCWVTGESKIIFYLIMFSVLKNCWSFYSAYCFFCDINDHKRCGLSFTVQFVKIVNCSKLLFAVFVGIGICVLSFLGWVPGFSILAWVFWSSCYVLALWYVAQFATKYKFHSQWLFFTMYIDRYYNIVFISSLDDNWWYSICSLITVSVSLRYLRRTTRTEAGCIAVILETDLQTDGWSIEGTETKDSVYVEKEDTYVTTLVSVSQECWHWLILFYFIIP